MRSSDFDKCHRTCSHRFIPRGEPLEPRWLLACQIEFDAGVLTVMGNEADDTVAIVDDGRGNVQISCTDSLPPLQIRDEIGDRIKEFQGVNQVVVETDGLADELADGGNDTVDYFLVPSFVVNVVSDDTIHPVRPVDLRLDCGGGNDIVRIRATEAGDVQVNSFFDILKCDVDLGNGDNLLALDGKGGDIILNVTGGRGADEVIVHAKPVPACLAGVTPSRLTADIRLGGGNDVVTINAAEPDADSSFEFIKCNVDLGNGDNLLALDGKGGDVVLNVAGGSGVDKVIVHAKPVPAHLGGVAPSRLMANIRLGGGDDETAIEAEGYNVVKSMIAGGGGNDVIKASYSLAAFDGEVLPGLDRANTVEASIVRIAGGGGEDQVDVQLAGSLDRAMRVSVFGQSGADTLKVHSGLQVADDARLSIYLNGGRGDDTIALRLTSEGADNGQISAAVFGGIGNDLLTLLANDVTGRFLIDGGWGWDEYTASDNVVVRNCESMLDLRFLEAN